MCIVVVVVNLVTSTQGVFKEWHGDVPTPEKYLSGPRLCQYFKPYFLSSPPHLLQPFMDLSFPPLDLHPTAPHFSPFNVNTLSRLQPLLPLNSLGSGVNIHLDIAATHRPPLLVYALPSLSGRPLEVLNVCLWLPCPSSARPPFDSLDLDPGPCQLLGVLLSEGTSLPLPVLVTLTSAPPLSDSTGDPVPCRSWRVFVAFFISPCTLCIRLVLPVFRAISWCLLVISSLFGCPFALGW